MTKKEQQFVTVVWDFYKSHGRNQLPWRKTKNPYRILVSEVMLQQTQVERVSPKYKEFMKTFPTVLKLADASLGDVLRKWQGLGYNRRAKFLHQCAKEVVSKYGGYFPKTKKELIKLPGVGEYTASAILAFAYNIPEACIETNIRTVYLHHFCKKKELVSDTEILKRIKNTLDKENPRGWYWALMDYGAHIKKKFGNQNLRSTHYTKQSRFEGSDRQIRGAILKLLAEGEVSREKLIKILKFDTKRIESQLKNLEKEGMIQKKKSTYLLP